MNSKTKSIQLPYMFKPRNYQLPFLKAWDSGCKRLFLVWHRRSGKDKTVFANLPKRMMERVGTYYYFLPTYNQARKVIWTGADKDGFRFLDHFPEEIVKTVNKQEMVLELVNGSILQLVGTDNVDRIVGTNPVGVVFSEYSLMKEDVWNLISPILRENDGWAIFIMTPRGTNHAYDLMKNIEKNESWFTQVLTVEDTKAINREGIEEARAEMPQDLFEQEFYCKFISSGLSFFRRIDENIYDTKAYRKKELALYQIGLDLAKYNDYTVITPFCLNDFHVMKQDSFNQMDYNLQKARIETAYLKNNKGRIVMDSTGIGEPIFDDLSARGINVFPYRFTATSRKDLLTNLQMLLEQDRIKIPDDEELIDELKSMSYGLNNAGNTVIRVPNGKHDDRIMSLALAVWDIPQEPIRQNILTGTTQTGGVDSFYPEFGI